MNHPFSTSTDRDQSGPRWNAHRPTGDRSLLRRPADWPVLYHTVRNMKPVQLTGIVERRLRHAVVPRLPVDFDARYDRQVPDELVVSPDPIRANLDRLRESLSETERAEYRATAVAAAEGRYTFLDRTIAFGDRIDWDHPEIDDQPIFWRLKLSSFEAFERLVLGWASPSGLDGVRSRLEAEALAWDASNPIGEGAYLRRSWTPHSVSLRVLHWSRYVAWCAADDAVDVPDRLVRMIYRNALFLANHVEHEIGGNHLVENAAALIVAGVLFRDHDTGWIRAGRDVLNRAGRDQFLADGGHFERSPMYHVTVLRRYATATDLLSAVGLPTVAVETVAEHAMGFLSSLVAPSGRIPLLNDSVHGEAIRATSCLAYCRNCSVTPTTRSLHHPDGSGYRTLSTDDGTLLFDVGDVGPPHLPAHSHNDQLSVLLWVDGQPVCTDTGVYDYGGNVRRQYARSVAAHNTAQYGETEPIPTAGSYPMGKRTTVSVDADTGDRIDATHVRRGIRGPSYEHRRSVTTTASGWRIRDHVSGNGTYTVRYHFHPSVDVQRAPGFTSDTTTGDEADDETVPGTPGLQVRTGGGRLVRIRFPGTERVRVTQSPYFPEYGRERSRPMVAITSATGDEIRTRLSVDDPE